MTNYRKTKKIRKDMQKQSHDEPKIKIKKKKQSLESLHKFILSNYRKTKKIR